MDCEVKTVVSIGYVYAQNIEAHTTSEDQIMIIISHVY